MCRGPDGHRLGHPRRTLPGRLLQPAQNRYQQREISGARAPDGESRTPYEPSAPARVVEKYRIILLLMSRVVGGGVSHGA